MKCLVAYTSNDRKTVNNRIVEIDGPITTEAAVNALRDKIADLDHVQYERDRWREANVPGERPIAYFLPTIHWLRELDE